MGNQFSNEKFMGSLISEALIDGQKEETMRILQDPKQKEILNDLLYKKDVNGRTVLHLVLTLFLIDPLIHNRVYR